MAEARSYAFISSWKESLSRRLGERDVLVEYLQSLLVIMSIFCCHLNDLTANAIQRYSHIKKNKFIN